MKLILIVGQSNNHWGTGLDATLDYSTGSVLQWPMSGSYVGSAILATEPLFYPDQQTGKIGHALPLCRLLADDGERRIIVPAAHGDTAFSTSPNHWQAGQSLALSAVNAANASIVAIGAEIEGIVWNGGQSDVDHAVSGSAFQTYLDALFAYFRANITGAENCWIIVEGFQPEYLTAKAGAADEIQAVLADTPRRVKRCAFVDGIAGVTATDNTHYTAAGQRALAPKVYAAIPFAKANVNAAGDGPHEYVASGSSEGGSGGGGSSGEYGSPFTLASYNPTNNGAGNNNRAVRVASAALSQPVDQIRVTIRPASGGMALNSASVGKQGSGASFTAAPTPLTFGGNAGFSSTTTDQISDWVDFNGLIGDVPLFDFDLGSGDLRWSSGASSYYGSTASPVSYNVQSGAGFVVDSTGRYLLVTVEGRNAL